MNGVSLFICGDIVNYTKELNFVGTKLASVIRKADCSICNFEGPELKPGQTASCPHQEPGTATYLKDVGFDLMLLANNHITELGYDGVRYCIETIKSTGVDYIGAGTSWEETYRPLIKEINGMRFGFINICETQTGQYVSPSQNYGYAWIGYSKLFDEIEELSTIADKVIVFVHAGLEHYPLPLPEIRIFYKKLCDAGATAVIGGHPHAAQGYEYYNDKFIAYSLGNFFFPHKLGIYESENVSYSLLLDFEGDGNIGVNIIHHSLSNNIVEIENDDRTRIDVNGLCNLLTGDYEHRATEMCVKAYNNLCLRLLTEATCGDKDDATIIEIVKNFLRKTLLREKYVTRTKQHRNELLLRLFENETYRYTIIRALNNIKQ